MLASILALALVSQCQGNSCAVPPQTYQPIVVPVPAPAAYQAPPIYRQTYASPIPARNYIRPRGVFGRLFRR